MNRKNQFSINSKGETVDKYGRVFEGNPKQFDKRRKRKEAYPSPNSMEVKR